MMTDRGHGAVFIALVLQRRNPRLLPPLGAGQASCFLGGTFHLFPNSCAWGSPSLRLFHGTVPGLCPQSCP